MSFIHLLPCTSSFINSYLTGCIVLVAILYLYNPLFVAAPNIVIIIKKEFLQVPIERVRFSNKGILCILRLKSLSSFQNPKASERIHHKSSLASIPNHEILLLLFQAWVSAFERWFSKKLFSV